MLPIAMVGRGRNRVDNPTPGFGLIIKDGLVDIVSHQSKTSARAPPDQLRIACVATCWQKNYIAQCALHSQIAAKQSGCMFTQQKLKGSRFVK